MGINTEQVKQILLNIAVVIEENRQYLTDLDAVIGDGDHGTNMSKGFKVVAEKLNATNAEFIGDLFKITSTTLISNVGGASGPLYGTFFMKAAVVVKDKSEIDLSDFYNILKEGIAGVKMRGKSEQGEKTMLDCLIPVLNSINESIETDESAKVALDNAVIAAEKGVESTKDILATKGRASYLGKRSVGHIDPGAMSSLLMIKVIRDSVEAL